MLLDIRNYSLTGLDITKPFKHGVKNENENLKKIKERKEKRRLIDHWQVLHQMSNYSFLEKETKTRNHKKMKFESCIGFRKLLGCAT